MKIHSRGAGGRYGSADVSARGFTRGTASEFAERRRWQWIRSALRNSAQFAMEPFPSAGYSTVGAGSDVLAGFLYGRFKSHSRGCDLFAWLCIAAVAVLL